jgi:hypothetical protein
MPAGLRFEKFDAEFRARTTDADWQRILTVLDHPRYLDGVAHYDEFVPAVFANNIVLNKAVTEYTRFQTIVFTLHLHDTADPADPVTGLTLSRLHKLCITHDLASPGGVTAFVGLMLLAGYLTRQPYGKDRRVVHLLPTPKFVGIVEAWNRNVLQSIDAILPEGELAKAHGLHPRFGWEMRERSTQNILRGWKPLGPFPEALYFVSRHGGWMLLCRCVLEMLRQSRSEITPVSVDLAAFGKSFGVSRTHLRRLLEGAHAQGLLDAPPRNGSHILMSEKLFASCMAAQASELSNYRLCALAAKAALGLA